MFSKLKLNVKLIGGFLIVAIITLIVGGIGFNGVTTIEGYLEETSEVRLPSVQGLFLMMEGQQMVRGANRTLLLPGIDRATQQTQLETIDKGLEGALQGYKIYEPITKTGEIADIWNKFLPVWENWQKDEETYKQLISEYIQTGSQSAYDKAYNYSFNELAVSVNECDSLLGNITDLTIELANTEKEFSKSVSNTLTILSIACMTIGTVLALLLGIFLSRSISKPITSAINNLSEASQQVASASQQLSASSQQLAEGNSEQAASIQETSSTLEEASSMVQQNAENTRQAAALAGQARLYSEKGNEEMTQMVSSMSEIKKSSDQISKIIKVIDDIAFQTNILALNAAVEAARAGEAGMGFAVVAEEVRNLAQRSAQAAKDTADMIESNIELSDKGVSIAGKVAESLAEITIQAKKVNELLDEIAASSHEQAQGITQINKAISQMEQVTQMNAATSEESAAASEQLAAQAETMMDITQSIAVLVNGASAKLGVTGLDRSRNYYSDRKYLNQANGGHKKIGRGNAARISSEAFPGSRKQAVRPEDVIPLDESTNNF